MAIAPPRSCGVLLRARDLRKAYGSIVALDGVSFDVYAGETFGILGPNGAGKTTLLESLLGLRTLDGGTFDLLGTHGPTAFQSVKARIGAVLQVAALPARVRVRELLWLHSAVYATDETVEQALVHIQLEGKGNALVGSLSGGQRQRLAIALAVLGSPDLLIMDEPTSSLDPQARRNIWDLLRKRPARANASIIITTHQMEEAETLCDRVAIVDHGKIIAVDTPENLIAKHCPEIIVRFTAPPSAALSFPDLAVTDVTNECSRWTLRASDADEAMNALARIRSESGISISVTRFDRASLEDVFLSLTGHGIRE